MSSYIRYANIKDSDVLGDKHLKSQTTSSKDIIPDEFFLRNFLLKESGRVYIMNYLKEFLKLQLCIWMKNQLL
jgi:hypothetical protein